MLARFSHHLQRAAVSALSALGILAAACAPEPWPEPQPIPAEVLASEHEEWRLDREGKQTKPPGGPVLWVGLWELSEGANPFGSDPSLAISLPLEDSPPLVGILRLADGSVTLEPEPGAPIALADGTAVTEPLRLENDRSKEPTVLRLASLGNARPRRARHR